jgi:hypothetical protein
MPTTVTRWIAAVAAALIIVSIALNLIRSPTSSMLSSRLAMNVGVLVVTASLVVTNTRAKKALALGGLIIVTAACFARLL